MTTMYKRDGYEFRCSLEEARGHWLQALRSRRYEQGNGCLRTVDDKYCCLGVLTEVYMQYETGVERRLNKREYLYNDNERASQTVLVETVRAWVGLVGASGEKCDATTSNDALWRQNDVHNRTFVEIADLIETGDYYAEPSNTQDGPT